MTPVALGGVAFTMLLVSGAATAAPDADALITRLARPAPASIAFAEARFSSLLREPLIVSGELTYAGPASLERRVTNPYQESTQIRGESVSVERAGEKPRNFALKRAPELRGLLSGFSALLAGDAAAVKQDFSVQPSGTDEAWSLELTPLAATIRQRLERIVVTGGGTEPHCFSLFDAQGGASVMLLGLAAGTPIPPDVTLENLLNQCRAE